MSENNVIPIRPNLPEPEPLAGVPQLMPDIFSVYSEPAQVVLTCATRFHPHADGRVHGQPRPVLQLRLGSEQAKALANEILKAVTQTDAASREAMQAAAKAQLEALAQEAAAKAEEPK